MAKSPEAHELARQLYFQLRNIGNVHQELKRRGYEVSRYALYQWKQKEGWDEMASEHDEKRLETEKKLMGKEDELLLLIDKAIEPYRQKIDDGTLNIQEYHAFMKGVETILDIRNAQEKKRQALVKETQKITPEQKEIITKEIMDIFEQIPEVKNILEKHWTDIEKKIEEIQLEE